MQVIPEVYELPQNHGWTAKPGHKILVLDRGAVLLEFPAHWFVQLGSQQIDIRDGRSPEESKCVLAVSCLRLPAVDWSGLPLSRLLLEAVAGDDRERIAVGPIVEATREGLEVVWTELRVVDATERREARCRMCLARAPRVQSLLSFDFWPEDETRLAPVWENVLESLRLNARVDDPGRGRRIS